MGRFWKICVLFVVSAVPSDAQETKDLSARVKGIFRLHCLECHGGRVTRARISILDHADLLKRKVIVPGKPDDSALFQAITAEGESRMPPPGQPELKAEEIELIRRWVTDGATAFPKDVDVPVEAKKDDAFKDVTGVDYVLKHILDDIRKVPGEKRAYVRYFSLNHILTAGATETELTSQRDAFILAINHLSRHTNLVKPRSIDAPTNSIYALDISELGWHQQPFHKITDGKKGVKSSINLFDLALLEYPYAIYFDASESFERLTEEFLGPAQQVLPIPYLRMDWFVSTVTQPPLYEDFLQLPAHVRELERRLGVDAEENIANLLSPRAGMAVSGVSRNNRVVERHAPRLTSYYWKSYDFRTSKGRENIFLDPVHLNPAGGEMIFSLPNGLQGYFIADGRGERIDAAPTEVVTDKFASDRTVRNGLACMRCHDRGMKDFNDAVRPALLKVPGTAGLDKRRILSLYPEAKQMESLVLSDRKRFEAAVRDLVEDLPKSGSHPLVTVSKRFLDDPIHLTTAAGELGLKDSDGLANLFKLPQFIGLGLIPLVEHGVIRRDAWEDYYDQVIRALGLGTPIVPIDGLLRKDYPAIISPFKVELTSSAKGNIVKPGDEIHFNVKNDSTKPLYIELIGTSTHGKKRVMTPPKLIVGPGEVYRFPADPMASFKVGEKLGRESVTLFASESPFPPGEVLRGSDMKDRVLHGFYALEREKGQSILKNDAGRLVKKTIEIETR